MIRSGWEAVIGLEIHVQLATASKTFSSSATTFGAPPNSLTDPVVLALPGALPSFNRRALELALRLGLATGSEIRARSRFARKHYFYPDLPKGYQISQFDEPLCHGGEISFYCGDQLRQVRLNRIHLEEDAGKSSHAGSGSRVDLNRAGVPLVEVVTGPDLRSATEAAELMRALHTMVRHLQISEGDMEKGQMRCDANVSVRRFGDPVLGTRTELKNINSFRFVEQAIDHEIERQVRVLEGGGSVTQETRLWDASAGVSFPSRSKEEANDYRYLPDPDLPPLVVSEAMRAEAMTMLRQLGLPIELVHRYVGLGLPLDDARRLVSAHFAGWFETAIAAGGSPRAVANWMLGELAAALARDGIELAAARLKPAALAELVTLVDTGAISSAQAKVVFAEAYATGAAPRAIVAQRGLSQIQDEGELRAIAQRIIDANPNQVAAYRGGKEGIFGFFVGQVMKATAGRANPQVTSSVLRDLLKT